jgi:hypothetical protein
MKREKKNPKRIKKSNASFQNRKKRRKMYMMMMVLGNKKSLEKKIMKQKPGRRNKHKIQYKVWKKKLEKYGS